MLYEREKDFYSSAFHTFLLNEMAKCGNSRFNNNSQFRGTRASQFYRANVYDRTYIIWYL